jgi:CheY-like chemotaxis protein
MATVLIVDDTAVDRRLAAGLIEESEGIDVIYAEDGEQAVQRIQDSKPDIVVTDLQMPRMDGLELVNRVRLTDPDIPVILMTSKGSEEIAVQALEQGASSYVPKSVLSTKLRETVEDLLAMKKSGTTYAQLLACQRRVELEFDLNNDPALADALTDLVQQVVEGIRLTDHTGKFRIGVALREALLNAMFRGNLELSFDELQTARERLVTGGESLAERRRHQRPYCDRLVHVTARLTRDEARFVIRDEGPGFDYSLKLEAGERFFNSFDATQGRGLLLMRTFMDEISYNAAGNEVTLVKRRDPQ